MDAAYTGNSLPHGQEPIYTSNIARLIALADQLTRTEQAPSTVGILAGTSGTGKTTAAYWYQSNVEQEKRLPPLACKIVDVMPQATTKGLLDSITQRVGGQPRSRSSHEALRQALIALEQSRLRLLIIDNTDYLRQPHLEVLRPLVEKTACSLLLIGHPRMLKDIKMHLPFATQGSLYLQFRPLPDEEVFATFLPQLNLPGWAFDPKNEADLLLGKYLWRNARPSLRRLCLILAYASQIAHMRDQTTITLETIRLAVHMMTPPNHPFRSQSEEEE